jgi:hypothetical protein
MSPTLRRDLEKNGGRMLKLTTTLSLALFILVAGGTASVFADPITYQIALTVTARDASGSSSPLPNRTFTTVPEIGDTLHGTFSLDNSILQTDGTKNGVALSSFRIEIGGIVWDMLHPLSSAPDATAFQGFRGMFGFSSSPSFVVNGGEITQIVGGVYGGADVPFIDFYPNGVFSSLDAGNSWVTGTLSVANVPAASAILLVGAGLGVWAITRRRL